LGSSDNTDVGNPKAYNDNEILLQNVSPSSTAGICVVDSGNYNKIRILSCNSDTVFPGTFSNAVTYTSTSHFGRADVRTLGYSHTISTFLGATPFPIIDNGASNSYTVNGQPIQIWEGADRGAAQAGGTQRNYLPILSFSAGTGASAVSTPTNSF